MCAHVFVTMHTYERSRVGERNGAFQVSTYSSVELSRLFCILLVVVVHVEG